MTKFDLLIFKEQVKIKIASTCSLVYYMYVLNEFLHHMLNH